MIHSVATLSAASSSRLTDQELLRRYAGTKDQQAFATLVHRYSNMVMGVCRRASVPAGDAEDVCQAVFLLLSTKAHAVAWKLSIANWLYTTARHLAAKVLRQRQRRARRESVAARHDSVTMVEDMTVRELFAILEEEIARLPALYREPLVLTYFNDASRQEVAVRLGIPRATVKIRLQRARHRLSAALLKRGVTAGLSAITLASVATGIASAVNAEAVLAAVGGSPSDLARKLAHGVVMSGMRTFYVASIMMVITCVGSVCLLAGAQQIESLAPTASAEPAAIRWLPPELPDPVPHLGDSVKTAAYSPHGKYLAVSTMHLEKTNGYMVVDSTKPNPGTNATITLYDTSTWKVVLSWKTELPSTSLCFAMDGESLYSAQMDSKVYQWDVKTGKRIGTLELSKGKCTKLVMMPDGKRLIAAYESALAARLRDGTFLHDQSANFITLWNLETRKEVRTFQYDEAALLPISVALSVDGGTLVASYHASQTASAEAQGFHGIIGWDINTGKELRRYDLPRSSKDGFPLAMSIVLPRDGQSMVVAGGEVIASGQGQRVVGKVWCINRVTGKLERTVADDRHGLVRSLALSSEGTRLYVAVGVSATAHATNQKNIAPEIQCWDVESWKQCWVHQDSQGKPETQVLIAPGLQRLHVAGLHGLKFLETQHGKPRGALIKAAE
jgi:RNA polymerase sigma factor (sigma-70 family)